ncbi:MAG: aspartyl/glutamyl-tRNA amidotransferase subunit C [Candidatus Diapherotrites archaeon]|nr:aspartyl/glutamyl-tRNA amidotransferase subunit C [Candidatus Diapherotrites archaeon]
MNKIDEKHLKKVSEVCRLNLNDEKLREFSSDSEKLFGFFSKIDQDYAPKDMSLYLTLNRNPFRKDTSAEMFDNTKAILDLAPKRNGKYFKVPKNL